MIKQLRFRCRLAVEIGKWQVDKQSNSAVCGCHFQSRLLIDQLLSGEMALPSSLMVSHVMRIHVAMLR